MRDTPISQYIRKKRGLPDNWRVYKTEAVPVVSGVSQYTKVRLTGSLVRPVDPAFEASLHRDFDWIKPEKGRAQMTISTEEYDAIYQSVGDA